MISRRYNFFDRFALRVAGAAGGAIVAWFDDELSALRTEGWCDGGPPLLGIVEVRPTVSIPDEAVLLQSGLARVCGDTLYVQYEGRVAALRMRDETFEITCEERLSPLAAFHIGEVLLRLVAVRAGIVFLHSSAFTLHGRTFVVNAFGGTGKTNLLLDVLEAGGDYLADDLVAITGDGAIYPYRKRLNLLYYNFEYQPALLGRAGISPAWLRALRLLRRLEPTPVYRRLRLYKVMARVLGKLNRHVDHRTISAAAKEPTPARSKQGSPPSTGGGRGRVEMGQSRMESVPVDHFIWLERSKKPTGPIVVSPDYFVDRMSCCLRSESRQLGPWVDYLSLIAPEVRRYEATQDEILRAVAARPAITGINKMDGDDRRLFRLIEEMSLADG